MYQSGTVSSWRGRLIKLDNCIWWTMGEVLWVGTQDSPWNSIICSHLRNTSVDKICHSWSRFWRLMSKICVSSCSTVSDCEFRVFQVISCSSTYIMQWWRSIQILLKMPSSYMIMLQPMQHTLLGMFGGIGGEKYKKKPLLLTLDHMTMIWITNWSSCCMGSDLQIERTF